MKKLYRRGTVHPSPPLISDHLAFLPAAILSLTAALTPEDREVLAYLLSCSGAFSAHRRLPQGTGNAADCGGDHRGSLFNCGCFGCYTSYWVRWDSSPNRQLIHEIIDSFEDWLARSKNPKSRKERRKRGSAADPEPDGASRTDPSELGRCELESAEDPIAGGGGMEAEEAEEAEEDGGEKGAVRKFVSLIGERIWNVWGQ